MSTFFCKDSFCDVVFSKETVPFDHFLPNSFLLTHESWSTVRDESERLMLGHFDQRTELTAKQAPFFAALGLDPPLKILGIHPRA
ncbi:hypothetical protein B9L19_17245 [Geobacillus thermocatenulatus]|uniref:Uncharacterized protein n=1 Tax=Geobacillus thermocatenulatus TaxID=33938 RepID=A0AA91QMV2_9BACL|nr:hypothetical protein B9L19_17245 [Geobacillus thermocatenulatus]